MSALFALLLAAGGAHAPLPTAPAPRVKTAAGAVAPFDLTYMPRVSNSVIAVRPGELLKHTGEQEKTLADTARRMLAAAFAFIDGDLKAAALPELADVEQLILCSQITLGVETAADGQSSFGVNGGSSGLIRSARPFDWAAAVKKWFPKAEAVRHAGREYLRVPIAFGKETSYLALYAADDRTLAFDTDEAEIKSLLGRLDKKLALTPPPGWDEVCRETVALTHDTTAAGWLVAPEEPRREFDRALVTLARKSTGLAFGFSAGERTSFRLVAAARDEDDALDVRAALKTLVAEMANADEAGPAAKLFAAAEVSRKGTVVRARGEVTGNLLRRLLDPDAER